MISKSWVHHVDFYQNGVVGIDRSMGQLPIRLYTATPASLRRLDWAVREWSNYPVSRAELVIPQRRAMAPMRRSGGDA